MIDKISPVPLYVQIQDKVYEQIRLGNLSPGARVPSEAELAAQYAVSRMTARKALDGLVARGHLFRQQGKGTFVAEHVLSYGLSTMLSFSGTLRALGHEVATRVLHQDVIPASPLVAEKLRLSPNSDVIVVRRLRMVDGWPAAIHTAFMDYRVYAPILRVDLSVNSLLESIQQITHTPVAYTKDSVQAAVVSLEDMILLEVPKGSPVLEVEGVAFTANGQPTRFARAVYRGDMFRLVVTNTGDLGASLKVTNGASR
jgi:GntR family transcriptional regulator